MRLEFTFKIERSYVKKRYKRKLSRARIGQRGQVVVTLVDHTQLQVLTDLQLDVLDQDVKPKRSLTLE